MPQRVAITARRDPGYAGYSPNGHDDLLERRTGLIDGVAIDARRGRPPARSARVRRRGSRGCVRASSAVRRGRRPGRCRAGQPERVDDPAQLDDVGASVQAAHESAGLDAERHGAWWKEFVATWQTCRSAGASDRSWAGQRSTTIASSAYTISARRTYETRWRLLRDGATRGLRCSTAERVVAKARAGARGALPFRE